MFIIEEIFQPRPNPVSVTTQLCNAITRYVQLSVPRYKSEEQDIGHVALWSKSSLIINQKTMTHELYTNRPYGRLFEL